jgi:hypothetical protein
MWLWLCYTKPNRYAPSKIDEVVELWRADLVGDFHVFCFFCDRSEQFAETEHCTGMWLRSQMVVRIAPGSFSKQNVANCVMSGRHGGFPDFVPKANAIVRGNDCNT